MEIDPMGKVGADCVKRALEANKAAYEAIRLGLCAGMTEEAAYALVNDAVDRVCGGELHEFIGGWIEIVRLDNEKIMVVDEEGKLKGLPFNVAATLEYNDRTGRHDDIILGNALVCGIGEVR